MKRQTGKWTAYFCALTVLAAGCAKQEPVSPDSGGLSGGPMTLTMNPQAAPLAEAEGDTKTYLSGTNVLWSDTENVKLYYGTGTAGSGYTFVDSESDFVRSADNSKATFQFFMDSAPTGTFKMGAFYPASQGSTSESDGLYLTCPDTQTATATSYDPSALIMTASTRANSAATPWNCTFNRRVAVNKITLTGLSAGQVHSVVVTSGGGNTFAGKRRFNYESGAAESTFSDGKNSIRIEYASAMPASGTTLDVYFTSWEVAVGTTLTVRINVTSNGSRYMEAQTTLTRALAVNQMNTYTINTSGLGIRPSLKDFARQFVGILDTWTNNIGVVDADGNHALYLTSSVVRSNAWMGVHYIPISTSVLSNSSTYFTTAPNTSNNDVSEFGNQYTNGNTTFTVNGTSYNMAEAWVVAAKGLLDLMTTQGSNVTTQFTSTTYSKKITEGNGNVLHRAPIPDKKIYLSGSSPTISKFDTMPWYENNSNPDGDNIGYFTSSTITTNKVLLILQQWLYNCGNSGKVTNFFKTPTVTSGGMNGLMSPMRMLLIMARMYKYMLDTPVKTTTWTNMNGKSFDTDLYGFGIGRTCPQNSVAAFAGNMARFYATRRHYSTTGTSISAIPQNSNTKALRVSAGYNRVSTAANRSQDVVSDGNLLGAANWIVLGMINTDNDTSPSRSLGDGTLKMSDNFHKPWNSSFQQVPGNNSSRTTASSKTFGAGTDGFAGTEGVGGTAGDKALTWATSDNKNKISLDALSYFTYYSWSFAYVSGNSNMPNYVTTNESTPSSGKSFSGCGTLKYAACANRIFYMNAYFFARCYRAYIITADWNGQKAKTKFNTYSTWPIWCSYIN